MEERLEGIINLEIGFFAENAFAKMLPVPGAYQGGPVTHARDVAKAVWNAVTNPSSPMKIPAGADALLWAKERGVI